MGRYDGGGGGDGEEEDMKQSSGVLVTEEGEVGIFAAGEASVRVCVGEVEKGKRRRGRKNRGDGDDGDETRPIQWIMALLFD